MYVTVLHRGIFSRGGGSRIGALPELDAVMEGSLRQWGIPIFRMEHPIKMDDLGVPPYPHGLETSIWYWQWFMQFYAIMCCIWFSKKRKLTWSFDSTVVFMWRHSGFPRWVSHWDGFCPCETCWGKQVLHCDPGGLRSLHWRRGEILLGNLGVRQEVAGSTWITLEFGQFHNFTINGSFIGKGMGQNWILQELGDSYET